VNDFHGKIIFKKQLQKWYYAVLRTKYHCNVFSNVILFFTNTQKQHRSLTHTRRCYRQ